METIRYGATGSTVKVASWHLSRHGLPIDPENVVFDWHMYVRTLQFQIAMFDDKSDMDGIIGPKTWGALMQGQNGGLPTPTGKPPINIVQNSPNQSVRGATITHIVLHNTAGGFTGSVDWLCNREADASAHLVIGRSGETAQLVPFEKKAWHAGNARMNANSIGIEIEATANQRGMTAVQEARVIEWLRWLMAEYHIPMENVGIHRWYRNTTCPVLIWPTDDGFRTWRLAHCSTPF